MNYNLAQPSDLELSIFRYINDWPAGLHGVFAAITLAGGIATALLLWVIVAYWLAGRRASWATAIAGVGAWVTAQLIKLLVERPRPQATLDTLNTYGHHYSSWSFPSGHATFVAACAVTIALYDKPRHRPWLIAAILLVGISRIYLGAHFPLDVIAGWALGTTVAIAVKFALDRWIAGRRRTA